MFALACTLLANTIACTKYFVAMKSAITVDSYENFAFKCAVAGTQGLRDYYEDAHAVSFQEHSVDMWLLDGHNGGMAAQFGASALAKELGQATKGQELPSRERISQSFRTVDNQLRQELKGSPDNARAGSTVVGVLAAKQSHGNYTLKLINCGDSRGLVMKAVSEVGDAEFRTGAARRRLPVIVESIDHKPGHPGEKARIEAAGGRVLGDQPPRIDGNLAVSRGLGDFKFKSDRKRSAFAQKVTCDPDIYEISELEAGALVVLACDGLWDVMTTKDVVSFVSSRVCRDCQAKLSEIAEDLVRASLKKKSRDNVTVLLAQLHSASGMQISSV